MSLMGGCAQEVLLILGGARRRRTGGHDERDVGGNGAKVHGSRTAGPRDGPERGVPAVSQRAAGRPAGVPGRSLFSLLSVST